MNEANEATEAVKFNCSKCGLCCKNLGSAVDRAKENPNDRDIYNVLLRNFPYKPKKDGSCSKLKKNGICGVYRNRPTLCDVDRLYEDIFFASEEFPTKESFFLHQAKACNKLIVQAKAPEELMINLKDYEPCS